MQQSEGVTENSQERLHKLSWLGGIVDGEGSVGLSTASVKKRMAVRPNCFIANSNPEIIDMVKKIFEENYIAHHISTRTKKGKTVKGNDYLPITNISISGYKRINRFLDLIQPYLVGKAKICAVVKEFTEKRLKDNGNLYDERDIELIKEIWELNGSRANSLKTIVENPQRLLSRTSNRWEKGHLPWNTGKRGYHIHTEESLKKVKATLIPYEKGHIPWAKGRKFSEEHRRRISESLKGRPKSLEHRRNVNLARKGKRLSEEHRRKISITKTKLYAMKKESELIGDNKII